MWRRSRVRAVVVAIAILCVALPAPALAVHYSRSTVGHSLAYQMGYGAGEANCAEPGREAPLLTNNSEDFKQGYQDGCTAAQKKWQFRQGYDDGYRACQDKDGLQAPPRGPLDYARGFTQGCQDALQRRPRGNPDEVRRGARAAQGVQVAEVTPQGGPAAGGQQVQIRGQGFTGAHAVAFGQVQAASFQVDSDTQITAVVPPGAPGAAVPVTVVNMVRVTALAGGTLRNGYALQSDGTVWAWGDNQYGQLGTGSTEASNGPVQVKNLTGVTAIAAAADAAYALKRDGTVWAWGNTRVQRIDSGNQTLPAQVAGLAGVTALAAAADTGYALKADGTVWAWGSPKDGRLGNGAANQEALSPVQVRNLSGVVAIAAHMFGGYALKGDGTVWAWGLNDSGQLGRPWTADSRFHSVPVPVQGLTGVKAIAGGTYSGYALKADGSVWAWGNNTRGELGIGYTWDMRTGSGSPAVSRPVQVPGLSGVTAIAAAVYKAFALKQDGSVWEWGQMSDTSFRYTPAQVEGLSGVNAIFAGEFTALALRPDGTVRAWGEGRTSLLLPGGLGRSPRRVEVLDPEPVSNVPGPGSHYTYEGGTPPPGRKPELTPPPPPPPPPPGDNPQCDSPNVPTYMKRQLGCPGYGETVQPPPPPPPPPPPSPPPPPPPRTHVECDSWFVPTYVKRQAGCPGHGEPVSNPPAQEPAPPPAPSPVRTIIDGFDCDSPDVPRVWKVALGCP